MEFRRADRASRLGVEEHDVGVAPNLDRALPVEAEQAGRCCRQQVYHPLHGDAATGDAAIEDGRQEGFDPGSTIADLVEGNALGGARFLDSEPVGDVIRGDEVEGARREAIPQRVTVGRGPQRWRDERPGAGQGIGLVVALFGEREVMRAGFGVGADAGCLCLRHVAQRLRARQMDDVDRSVGGPGEGHGAVGRHGFGPCRAGARVVARCRVTTLKR